MDMTKRISSLLLAGALALSLAACAADPAPGGSIAPSATPTQPTIIQPTDEPEPSAEPSVEPSVEPSPEPAYPLYTFGTFLEESEPVEDDSFFDTAAFLGDSRTEGLQLFSGLYNGDFFWQRGMTVFRVDSADYRKFEINGQSYTLIGALRQKTYESVYIMVGVNELGYPVSSYESGLATFVDQVLEAQPEAVVYLQVMPPINDAIARESGLASYINNTQLTLFNEALIRVATEKRVVLLNTAEVYRDANGQLLAEVAADGCHFTYDGYTRWADYLRTHVMDKERYLYNRALAEEGENQ